MGKCSAHSIVRLSRLRVQCNSTDEVTPLNKIGELAATKGGSDARKAIGANAEFSQKEQDWLEEVIRPRTHKSRLDVRFSPKTTEFAEPQGNDLPEADITELFDHLVGKSKQLCRDVES